MHRFALIILFASIMAPTSLFNFTSSTDIKTWYIVDDVVMGGRSSGTFTLNEDGHGVFAGNVSLENNGGFSSVRHKLDNTPINGAATVVLKVKGDGRKYQLRIKANARDYYSYIATFATNTEWQEIQIPLQEMYPSFRGRKLDQPNFSSDHVEEIAFLIGNKKPESFKLMIDKIELK